MGDNTEDPLGIETMFNAWTKSINDLIGSSSDLQSKFQQQPFSFFQSPGNSSFESPLQPVFRHIFKQTTGEGAAGGVPFSWPFQTGKEEKDSKSDPAGEGLTGSISTAMKNWQAMAAAMASPESMTALFKGMGTVPEMLMDFTHSTMSGMLEFHQRIVESVSRMGESVQAYKFDNIDENIFQAWSDIYEKEFRKFLQIPQLGLTREYQEKINDMADKFNICQTNIAEFMRILSMPFQKTAAVMQNEIRSLAEKGELSEDPQFYYQMWLKILEGHFMKLFQTQEYIEALTKTVGSMTSFTSSRENVLEDMLKIMPVASRSEVDDMAKELHQLKKEMRNLKKRVNDDSDE